jgi:hypothetical protein
MDVRIEARSGKALIGTEQTGPDRIGLPIGVAQTGLGAAVSRLAGLGKDWTGLVYCIGLAVIASQRQSAD